MKMICVSPAVCNLKKSFIEFLKNLEKIIGLTGNDCLTFVLFYFNVQEPSTKIVR